MPPPPAPHRPQTGSGRRREDVRLITGAGSYVADLGRDALRIAFVRSTEAHALVTSVDVSEAASSEGVLAVLTGDGLGLQDIPGDSLLVEAPDFPRPNLARDRVRYVGEPVAAVVAETDAAAVDAAERVWVEYRPLPVVGTPEQALRDEVVLHPAAGTNVVERFEQGEERPTGSHPVEAEVTVENQRVAPLAIEPLAFLATPDGQGGVEVWCGHQRPHGFRGLLARLLGLEPGQVRVIVPDVGGAFGLKGKTFPEYAVTARAALLLGRAVLWTERRREHLSGGTHGRGATMTVRLAGDSDGTIRRAEVDILADVGAYPDNGSHIPALTRLMAPGPYHLPDLRITSSTVVTNRAPTGSYRGAGRPEASYALERAMDAFAAAAGFDPVEVRLRNLIPPEHLPHRTATGALYDSGDYPRALREAVRLVDLPALRRSQERRRREGGNPLGVGIGVFIERAGGGLQTGELGRVEVDREGRATVFTGSVSAGQGHETVWARVVGDALGVGEDRVTVVAGDTGRVARGGGTGGSRSAQLGASAAWMAAQVVRGRACELAAALLEASVEDLVVADGVFSVAGVPGSGLDWAEVARAAADRGVELAAEEWFVPGAQTFPYGVHVAVVEVELETGEVHLLELVTVDDCGEVLDPMIVHGQLQGSLLQGVGQALLEAVEYSESGQILTGSLIDYPMPRAADAPPMRHGRLVSPAPSNPLGVKGTGESGCIGAPPAVVNAVLDALRPHGVHHLDMPLRPARVWEALQQATEPLTLPA